MRLPHYLKPSPRATRRTRKASRLNTSWRSASFEPLEERRLLTVLFTPQNTPETAHQGTGIVDGANGFMPVYTVFWGSYWATSAGQSYASNIEGSINTALYFSPYMNGLSQYGVNYPAGVPGSGTTEVFDYSDPAAGFSGATLAADDPAVDSEAQKGMQGLGLPFPNASNPGVYFVITAPGVTIQGAGGYHTWDWVFNPHSFTLQQFSYGWISTDGTMDEATNVISHEATETITDPYLNAWTVTPALAAGTNEISDNEAQNYTYRLNGYLVQSYLSQNGFYEVTDGNSQNFYVNNGQLIVDGGQFGDYYPDSIVVGTNGSGGVQVTMNGETVSFDPGKISSVVVNTDDASGGNVDVQSTAVATTVNAGAAGVLFVAVGNNLDSLPAALTVNGNGATYLDVNDTNNSNYIAPTQDTITNTTLTRIALGFNGLYVVSHYASINYSGLAGLQLDTGALPNLVFAESTSAPTTVNAGTGNTLVEVTDQSENLDDLPAPLTVNGSGATQLIVNDQNNPNTIAPTQDTITNTTLTRTALGFNGINIVAHNASITYSGLGSLALDTGALLNFVFVEGTAAPTTVNAGAGNTLVEVTDQSENLDNLPASLTVNGGGATQLVVNDQNNPNAIAPTQDAITGTTLTRTALGFNGINVVAHNASISYSGLGSLALNTGALLNFVFVEGTSVPTTVNAGAGNTLVDVTDQSGNLDSLPAPLTVNGSGATQLVVNDQNNPNSYVPTQDTITNTSLARVAFGTSIPVIGIPGPHNASITYSSLGSLELDTGALPNLIHVESTAAPTTVNAGAGNTFVDVSPQAENLDNLPAALTVNGNGATALVVNDQNNPNTVGPTQHTITGTTLTRTALGFNGINVVAHNASISCSGLGSLALNTGALLNFVFVEGTSAPTTVNAGAGNTLVDVADQSGNLDNLPASLTVNGSGATQLVVNDQNNPNTIAPTQDTITGTTLTRTALGFDGINVVAHNASITYSGLGSLELDTGTLLNLIFVEGTAVPTTVNAGAGNALVDVTEQAENLDSVQGALSVNGTPSLIINDQLRPTAATYNVAAATISRTGAALISYANVGSLALYGGGASDTFTVASPLSATAVSIDGGGGTNTLAGPNTANAWTMTGPNSGTLGAVAFANFQNLVGGTGSDTLTGANTANTWTLTGANAGTLNGVTFSVMEHLVGTSGSDSLAGLNTTNAWNLTGPNSGTIGALTFDGMNALIGGTGDDTLTGASTTNAWTLTGVKAGLVNGLAFSSMDHLVGGTGDDTLTGANVTNAWKLTGANAGTLGTMTFAGIEHLVGGTGADTLTGLNTTNAWTLTGTDSGTLGSLTFAAMNTLVGGTGTDTLTGPNGANTWLISAVNAGKINALAFKSMESVKGGTAVDTFEFSGSGSVVSLNGGGAPAGTADWLDYSRLLATVPVTVNLATHSATRVTNPISNIENVRGGKGPNTLTGDSVGNILIGGAGNDVIVGGTGKSLLIGDKGADSITGHSANDILIGDYTSYDASTATNNTALMAILNEWKSGDSYATRFAEINDGTIAGHAGVKLNYGPTVKNDSAADTVTGSALATAHDWYFASTGDTTTNLHTGEYLNNAVH